MKTCELIGPALRYAVACAMNWNGGREAFNLPLLIEQHGFRPDLLWELGGPIIDRERITISQGRDLIASIWQPGRISMTDDWYRFKQRGPTPLIAAMRCLVASKLGDEVEVPQSLLT